MSELKTLIKKRSAIKSKLTIFGNHIKLIETSKPLTELQIIGLQCRLRKIEPLYEEFDTLQTEIEILSDEPPVEEVPVERVQFDDYYLLVARAKSLLAAGRKDSESVAEFSDAESGGRVRNLVRLPKIDYIVLKTDVVPVTTPTRVFLSTALVKVVDGKGNKHTARAILDNGSGINIVSEAFCSKLGLPRRNVSSTVLGFNNHVSHSTQSCNLTIESMHTSYRTNIDCYVFTNVTDHIH
ncbi:uncharacterized protein LOC126911008 [Spodoptera frugiperda]|uniref:Uncharacterized protein LOC126911008 n=1 Tax=Spodoptera frugiperda TaxID=7108 RepID=A0A9R0DR39_SPOFR|nr:uncharacterized protein LOC126911008 [Spodoptera frugiperda]